MAYRRRWVRWKVSKYVRKRASHTDERAFMIVVEP